MGHWATVGGSRSSGWATTYGWMSSYEAKCQIFNLLSVGSGSLSILSPSTVTIYLAGEIVRPQLSNFNVVGTCMPLTPLHKYHTQDVPACSRTFFVIFCPRSHPWCTCRGSKVIRKKIRNLKASYLVHFFASSRLRRLPVLSLYICHNKRSI